MTQRDSDVLSRFVFERTNVRGELVHLDATWRAILERRDYPEPVRELLGQAMAAAALLITTIKFSGSLILQIQGDGPVSLIVVQAKSDRTLRGLAHWADPVLPGPLAQQVGDARLAITIDQGGDRERYQGIVALNTEETLAHALEEYFKRSEQLATRLWLAAGDERAAKLLFELFFLRTFRLALGLLGDEADAEEVAAGRVPEGRQGAERSVGQRVLLSVARATQRARL